MLLASFSDRRLPSSGKKVSMTSMMDQSDGCESHPYYLSLTGSFVSNPVSSKNVLLQKKLDLTFYQRFQTEVEAEISPTILFLLQKPWDMYYSECAITCWLTILIQIFYVCGHKMNLGHALFLHDLQGNSYLNVVSSSISVRNHGANKVYSTNFLTSFFSQFFFLK